MRKISQVYDIESPSQIKDMSIDELTQLCSDIRTFLIESISKTGGHLSSNLGIVEVTVAMHYVFDSPKDKMIFEKYMETYTDAKPGMPFFLKMKGNTVIQILEKPMA